MNTVINSRLEVAFAAIFANIEKNVADAKAELCPFNEDAWERLLVKEANEARRYCGLSWSYYVELFSDAVDAHIGKMPEHHRARAYEIVTQDSIYESRQARDETSKWNSENGCCSHGITLGCCPRGCGS
ncbi:hypothetical protein [Xanthomonas sacchari]|uniref:hypothetical protein n=1 Tax=Xanthomonas sacchari TaxID=56458 RepID=UPI00225DEA37|nr:hypothetical protein [Xanthomonas sacchari]